MLKIEMEERIEELESVIEKIAEEIDSDDPDLAALRSLIAETLGDADGYADDDVGGDVD
jgi:hypothetical protein